MENRRKFEDPVPRSYQIEVLKRAENANTIVWLETGCGKTLIAVLLIRSLSPLFRKPSTGICVFLAPNVCLCHQQAKVIEQWTDLHVGTFVGGCTSDVKSWTDHLRKYEVFVMTPEILLRNLRHRFFNPYEIELLILDECHHCDKGHPYANIMTEFFHKPQAKCPKILGMTASPVNGKGRSPEWFKDTIERLEDILLSKVYTVKNKEELERFVPSCKLKVRKYELIKDSVEVQFERQMGSHFEDLRRVLLQSRLLEQMHAISRIFNFLNYCVNELGLWCAKQAVEIFLEESNNSYKETFLKQVRTCLDQAQSEGALDGSPLNCHLSTKVQLLLEVLDEYKETEHLRCIVFVERRIAAKVLSSLLNHLGINCECIASHRNSMRGMSPSFQKSALQKFRDGQIRCLVATNVAEEGLDVQSCSLVIRFDMPKTEKSNIQSRGRARQAGSDYVILVELGNSMQEKHLESLLAGEQIMQGEIRKTDCTRDIQFNYHCKESYCVESTGAVVNVDSGVSLLHHYCSTLKCNDKKPDFNYWPDENGIVCSVKLPENAQVDYIVGQACPTEEIARKIVCVEACKQLHLGGALSDYLTVSIHDKEADIPDSEPEEDQMGLYETVIPEVFKGNIHCASEGIMLVSYVLSIVPCEDEIPYRNFALFLPSCFDGAIEAACIQLDLGNNRKLTVNITPTEPVIFDKLKVSLAKQFHEKVLSTLWSYSSTQRTQCSSSRSYFLLPLLSGESNATKVDWKYLTSAGNGFKSCQESDQLLHFANCSIPINDAKRRLILTKHNERPIFYCILDILHGTTSDSPMPGSTYSNYTKYFLKKHNLHIQHPAQPLLQVKRLRRPKNCLLRRSSTGSRLHKVFTEELPPELCTVVNVEVDFSIVNTLTVLPSVMHRLECLFSATQVQKHIGLYISETSILSALTAASCNEAFSLERLELLGDSFLKLVSSFHFFFLYPEEREGFLSQKRKQVICNYNLYTLALTKKLETYARNGEFDPSDWVVPRFICTPDAVHNKNSAQICDKGHRYLSRKSIADVVEALIGAYIAECSAESAYNFMKWCGFELESEYTSTLPSSHQLDQSLKFDELEETLGYKFCNKSLLVEAFTHATYNENSYQRLEYLGDAVLDYLVVLHLYATFPLLQPGDLSDLKSATVNKHWLTYVSVRHNLHNYLLQNCAILLEDVNAFVEKISTLCFKDWQDNEPPKIFSDLVESLAGALFLDTQGDLHKTWSILKPIVDPIASPESLVLHPVRELQELSQLKKFSVEYTHSTEYTRSSCVVKFNAETVIEGTSSTGLNRKAGKKEAAADALAKLKTSGYQHPRHKSLLALETVMESNPETIVNRGLNLEMKVKTHIVNDDDISGISSEVKSFHKNVVSRRSIIELQDVDQCISSTEVHVSASTSGNSHDTWECPVQEANDISTSTLEQYAVGRPRQLLQEFCAKLRLPNPIYERLEERGPSHMKEFTYTARVQCTDEQGYQVRGDPQRSVRRAQDSAAMYALDHLKRNSQTTR